MPSFNGAFSTTNGVKNIFARKPKGRLRSIMNLRQYTSAKVNNEGERGSSRVHYSLTKSYDRKVVSAH